MRILITGGAGFIGSHLCERVLADGDRVICMAVENGLRRTITYFASRVAPVPA
jgi:nucleoside-diphosphate-sugar epimerase